MGIRILLADDSVTAQNMGKKILIEAGHDVVTVSNGAAAAKKIAEMKPDLALLDVFMPGYSGLELCEKLRNAADTTRLPVILTVGKMEPYNPQDGARVKADGVIIKPFEATDLTAAVERLAQKLTSGPKTVAKESKSAKPANYEPTVRLDSKQIAEMLKSGGAERPEAESATPSPGLGGMPASTPPAEFHVPAHSETTETAMPAFGGELSSAPETDSAPATMNSYMEEYLSDTPASAIENESPAGAHSKGHDLSPAPASNDLSVSTFESQVSSDAPVAALEEFEPTAAAAVGEIQTVPEPGFEATHQTSEGVTAISADPELETDPHKATTEFPTKFGTPEPDIYESPMTNVSQELVAASDAMLEATISGHISGDPQQSARPIDEFEARLQQAMASYQTEPAAPEPGEPQSESESAVGASEASDGFESRVEAGLQAFEGAAEIQDSFETQNTAPSAESPATSIETSSEEHSGSDSERSGFPVNTQQAAYLPESPAEAASLSEYQVADAITSSQVTSPEPGAAIALAHVAAPETDDTLIQQMRESLSDLPVDGRTMPELGSETDAIPMAMAAAAAASAPAFSSPSSASSQHEAAFEITRALTHALGAEGSSEATAEAPASQSDGSKPGDSNKMATAVERVLQRELPSLVWKVMAEIDLEKQRR